MVFERSTMVLGRSTKVLGRSSMVLEKALQGQEELSMDLAWFAHDQLKEAAAGVSGVDSEMYCLASTSLARFYMKVVKTPDNREKGTELVRKILKEAQVMVTISPGCPVAFNCSYCSACRETCTPGTGGGLPLLSWRKYRCLLFIDDLYGIVHLKSDFVLPSK